MQKSKPPMKKHILLLDLDGTIADPFHAVGGSLRYAFDELSLGNLTDDQIRKFIGPPLQQSLSDLCGFKKDLIDKVIKTYRDHHAEAGIALYRPYSGIEVVIEELRDKYSLFLATSKPQVYAEQILRTFKIRELFDGAYGPELDGTRNNKTDLLNYLLKVENLDPARCIMIGDRKHDIEAGRNTGTKTIGVLWGFGSREELESHHADEVIEHMSELSEVAAKLLQN